MKLGAIKEPRILVECGEGGGGGGGGGGAISLKYASVLFSPYKYPA